MSNNIEQHYKTMISQLTIEELKYLKDNKIVNIDYNNYTFSVRSKRFNFDDISFPKQLIRKIKLDELLNDK